MTPIAVSERGGCQARSPSKPVLSGPGLSGEDFRAGLQRACRACTLCRSGPSSSSGANQAIGKLLELGFLPNRWRCRLHLHQMRGLQAFLP